MADQWQDAMASLGYDYPGDIGIPDHRIYGRDPDIRRFLVHVVDSDGTRWREFLRFRDLLITDPRLAAEYEAVKLGVAKKHPTGLRSKYTEAKGGFIADVLARAARLAEGNAWPAGFAGSASYKPNTPLSLLFHHRR
jgi:GrpB-like predicted nucleotidyltransferase (UPF0157 family)